LEGLQVILWKFTLISHLHPPLGGDEVSGQSGH
jgi:hypothetical protein